MVELFIPSSHLGHSSSHHIQIPSLHRVSSFDRLDGKHVVFGQVKDGMDVVTKMESFGLHDGGVIKTILITNSGEISQDHTRTSVG